MFCCKLATFLSSNAQILTVPSAAPETNSFDGLLDTPIQLTELWCSERVWIHFHLPIGLSLLHIFMDLSTDPLRSSPDSGRTLTALTVSVWPLRRSKTPRDVSLYQGISLAFK
jgi:hypothetical protein